MADVTLRDVAAAAGVSLTTVSKVVTGRYGNTRIAPSTVARVRKAISAVGYVPNAAGRSLRTGRTGQIGVLLRPYLGEDNPAARLLLDSALLIGLSDAAAAHNLPLLIYPVPEGGEPHSPSQFFDGRVDGLLIRCAFRSEESFFRGFDANRLPLVTLWHHVVPGLTMTISISGRPTTGHSFHNYRGSLRSQLERRLSGRPIDSEGAESPQPRLLGRARPLVRGPRRRGIQRLLTRLQVHGDKFRQCGHQFFLPDALCLVEGERAQRVSGSGISRVCRTAVLREQFVGLSPQPPYL